LQAACPDEVPVTPVGRLQAMERRLSAMLQAANQMQPALDDFYASLTAERRHASTHCSRSRDSERDAAILLNGGLSRSKLRRRPLRLRKQKSAWPRPILRMHRLLSSSGRRPSIRRDSISIVPCSARRSMESRSATTLKHNSIADVSVGSRPPQGSLIGGAQPRLRLLH
jgi:hypothetical protein